MKIDGIIDWKLVAETTNWMSVNKTKLVEIKSECDTIVMIPRRQRRQRCQRRPHRTPASARDPRPTPLLFCFDLPSNKFLLGGRLDARDARDASINSIFVHLTTLPMFYHTITLK